MKLIADSGSTKTDWALIQHSTSSTTPCISYYKTQGINPVHQHSSDIKAILQNELLTQIDALSVDEIFFYGSGCRNDVINKVESIFKNLFPTTKTIEINSDMLGAARAVCGHNSGIACILGTGSNSCLYDGQKIVWNIPPLGYILGDEGSGTALGKILINAIFKGLLPDNIKNEFCTFYNTTLDDIIENVYRKPLPNRYIASFADFAITHKEIPEISNLIKECFNDFFEKNIRQYQQPDLPINAVGSIAYLAKDEFETTARQFGYSIGTILRSPIDGLITYHK